MPAVSARRIRARTSSGSWRAANPTLVTRPTFLRDRFALLPDRGAVVGLNDGAGNVSRSDDHPPVGIDPRLWCKGVYVSDDRKRALQTRAVHRRGAPGWYSSARACN